MSLDEMQEMMRRIVELSGRSFGTPEQVAARTSACPQALYADLLAAGPARDVGNGYYSLLSMEDIHYVNRHPGVEQGSKYLGSDRRAIPLGLDGELHRTYRRLLDPIFTAKAVAPLADSVRRLAHELIDGFIADGRADAYAAWCEPLPSTVFLSIMGLPMDDLHDFIHFKTLTLSTGEGDMSAEERTRLRMEAVTWIHGYFNRNLDEREAEPTQRDDIIGMLLSAEVDGHRLSRQDVLDILGLFMIAGLDTVASSLACILSYFAGHPEHRSAVVNDPALVRTAVEELLRFESPVSEGYRFVIDDIVLPSGMAVAAGSTLHISWAAANLDPAAFDDPMTVDLTRSPNPHIAFASGYHRCLGSHLARLELVTALEVWHERIPDYRLDGARELTYSVNPRAPHTLPLAWS